MHVNNSISAFTKDAKAKHGCYFPTLTQLTPSSASDFIDLKPLELRIVKTTRCLTPNQVDFVLNHKSLGASIARNPVALVSFDL
jgi:hypothetical protein